MKITTRFTLSYSLAIWLSCSSSSLILAQQSPATATFQQRDKNNDGKLGRDERPATLLDKLDQDRDGFVTEEELKSFWRQR
jgi:Ca2+-binding EF-hand superfamily protein